VAGHVVKVAHTPTATWPKTCQISY